jgi:dienelactone hydrolase
VLLSVVVLAAPGGVLAQVEVLEETVRIPLKEKRLLGGARELTLEGTVFRPASGGGGPLLVFNHGSTGAGRSSPKTTVKYVEVARFFVERGFTVLVPMRRGRGASDGDYLERYECDTAMLGAGLDRAIEDMDAVMAFVTAQGWAERPLLLGGMSRGGFLSIVYASTRPTGARAVINFAGGWIAEWCESRIHFHERMLASAGRTASLPMLWLYSENDRNYGPASVRASHRAFTGAGGTADLHLFPPIGHDGHILLPRSVSVWSSTVDTFLRPLAPRLGVRL